MDVAAEGELWGVDVGVGVDPYDCYFSAKTLPDRLCGAGDGADGYAVVSTKCQDKAASFCVGVYLFAQSLGDGGDSARVLHAAVIWVGLWAEIVVAVDLAVAVKVVSKFLAQLVEQAGGDEGIGGSIDAGFALAAAEANGHDAKLGGCGEELGTDG